VDEKGSIGCGKDKELALYVRWEVRQKKRPDWESLPVVETAMGDERGLEIQTVGGE